MLTIRPYGSGVDDMATVYYGSPCLISGPTDATFTQPEHAQTEAYITGRFG